MSRELVKTVNVGGMPMPLDVPLRAVEYVELVKVTTCEGDGQPTPRHQVEYYFSFEGQLIARRSPYGDGGNPYTPLPSETREDLRRLAISAWNEQPNRELAGEVIDAINAANDALRKGV